MKLKTHRPAKKLQPWKSASEQSNPLKLWHFRCFSGTEGLKKSYDHLDISCLNDNFPTNQEQAELNALLLQLGDVISTTTGFQYDSTTSSGAKAHSESVTDNIQELSHRSSFTLSIAWNTLFESSNL